MTTKNPSPVYGKDGNGEDGKDESPALPYSVVFPTIGSIVANYVGDDLRRWKEDIASAFNNSTEG